MSKYLGEELLASLAGTPYDGFTQAQWALEHISRYGGDDGDHHKQWVLDQVVRILLGAAVSVKKASWDLGVGRSIEYRIETGPPRDEYRAWINDWKAGVVHSRGDIMSASELALEFIYIHGQPAGNFHATIKDGMSRAESAAASMRLYQLGEHKQWMLDQVARILHGTPVISSEMETGEPSADYLAWVVEMKGEEQDGEYEYDWSLGKPIPESKRTVDAYYEGIAP